MTTTVCEDVRQQGNGFRSPPRVLLDWFQRSRDKWKRKYLEAKAELKKFKVRVLDVNRSRDRWKEKAKATERELEALQEELERLRHQVSGGASTDEPVENDATPGVEKKGVRKTAAAS